jgi:hypothetical protein
VSNPSRLTPLDRTPPPHWSLALRPFHAARWVECTGGFSAGAVVTLIFPQGVEGVGVCVVVGGDGGAAIPATAFLLPLREKVSAKLTDEGSLKTVRRPTQLFRPTRLSAPSTPHPTSLREATLSRKGRGIDACQL